MKYIGRFAPSPTGPLHAGSLVAALASWLDAKAAGGDWLVRIEDIDTPRCVPGTDLHILSQLGACGLHPDAPVEWQSRRRAVYQSALDTLIASRDVYPCACSRRDIEVALAASGASSDRHGDLVYPGTCRQGLNGRAPRAFRLSTVDAKGDDIRIDWVDRRLGRQTQNVTRDVGDFVLKRADGLHAYQLAVVVDDASQGVTHVVRGEDLADNTPRQIHLQRRLGLSRPVYLHTPLVLAQDGEKLSKQNGATRVDVSDPLRALRHAGAMLGLHIDSTDAAEWRREAASRWQRRYPVDHLP